MLHEEHADPLVELRKRLDDGLAHEQLTKTLLARRTGLSRGTIQAAFQAGGPVPSAATVVSLARALRLPVEELVALRRAAGGEARPLPSRNEGPGKPIGEWDPHDLEVHPAGTTSLVAGSGSLLQRVWPGYVRRDHDRALAAVVQEAAEGRSGMVVLVGSSSTGKTRACWEAVQQLAAQGWRLWHPYDPTRAEAAIADLKRVAPCTVVWLNEAQHYLGGPQAGERLAAALHTLLAHPDRRPVLIVGTLWPEFADRYTALPQGNSQDPHSQVRELLTGRMLTVPDAFDQDALQIAQTLAQGGDQLLTDALTHARVHGRVTQELAGGPELLRRYQHGSPEARALLEVAMDARRLGVGPHLTQTFLTAAAADYLADHDYDQLTEDWAEASYVDLARLVHGKQAPLRRTNPRPARRPPGIPAPDMSSTGIPPKFRLADYLEQYGRTIRSMLCPPDSFWRAAHTHLSSPEDLHQLATAAQDRHRLQWAHHLYQRAADASHPEALAHLAVTWEESGDRESAEALARRAADLGDTSALVIMAEMREESGDRASAEPLYRHAVDIGDLDALLALGRLRERAGDHEGAEALYQQAADTGHPFALLSLATVRNESGDREGAEAFQQAADNGNPFVLGILAGMREEAGDHEGAEALARRAADLGDLSVMLKLAGMREQAGDREGAKALHQQAVDADLTSDFLDLADLWEETADHEYAEVIYRRAIELGNPMILKTLVYLWEEAGDYERAGDLARKAADVGHFYLLAHLAELRERAGDHEAAEILYRRAADAGDRDALLGLAAVREQAGNDGDADALALKAADAGWLSRASRERWPHGLDPDGAPTPPWP